MGAFGGNILRSLGSAPVPTSRADLEHKASDASDSGLHNDPKIGMLQL